MALMISIRNTLYPKLQDHDLVKDHPNVRGIQKNVFFLSHNHKENGGDIDGLSKYNQYEVCPHFFGSEDAKKGWLGGYDCRSRYVLTTVSLLSTSGRLVTHFSV